MSRCPPRVEGSDKTAAVAVRGLSQIAQRFHLSQNLGLFNAKHGWVGLVATRGVVAMLHTDLAAFIEQDRQALEGRSRAEEEAVFATRRSHACQPLWTWQKRYRPEAD